MPHDEPWLVAAVEYVLDRTKHVIETFGPRDPGSDGERRAQEFVRDELTPYADEICVEPFQVSPKAMMSFVPVVSLLILIGTLGYEVFPIAALAASVLAFAIFILEFRQYREPLDPFFPKRTSHNVYAVRKASKVCTRRIILSGHVDAAYEWRYNLMGRAVLLIVASWAIAGILCVTSLNALHVLFQVTHWTPAFAAWHVLELARYAFVPACILAAFYTRFSVVSAGANDNLTGVFTAIGVFEHLHDTGTRFEHTEVCCLITGSEEAGLRGAKAFAAGHIRELKETPTAFLALDTLHDTEHLAVFNRDLNGTVRNDAAFSALVRDAGKACGYDLPYQTVYIGATDAAALTQAGIAATALVGMDPAPPRYYHTRLDHWNNMVPECIKRSLAIALATVKRYDQGFRL